MISLRHDQPVFPYHSPLPLSLITALLLCGCPRAERHTEEGGAAASAHLDDVSTRFVNQMSPLLCQEFFDWPPLGEPLVSEAWERAMSTLNPSQLATLSYQPLGRTASALCPRAIPPGSVTSDGRLPTTMVFDPPRPGLYDAALARTDEELRVRYEWTAIGLGCLSLDPSLPDDQLLILGERFLGAMGYTLESYLEASLAVSDEQSSQRIFQRIVYCAEQHRLRPLD